MGKYEVDAGELREAIEAGERALSSLREAEQKLDSARNWGLLDMFGGGSITGLIKHSKLSGAAECVRQAGRDLDVFRRELQDVYVPDMRIEISGFLTFADFFFDGFLADYLMQRKIQDARGQVSEAIRQTERVLRSLRGYQY